MPGRAAWRSVAALGYFHRQRARQSDRFRSISDTRTAAPALSVTPPQCPRTRGGRSANAGDAAEAARNPRLTLRRALVVVKGRLSLKLLLTGYGREARMPPLKSTLRWWVAMHLQMPAAAAGEPHSPTWPTCGLRCARMCAQASAASAVRRAGHGRGRTAPIRALSANHRPKWARGRKGGKEGWGWGGGLRRLPASFHTFHEYFRSSRPACATSLVDRLVPPACTALHRTAPPNDAGRLDSETRGRMLYCGGEPPAPPDYVYPITPSCCSLSVSRQP